MFYRIEPSVFRHRYQDIVLQRISLGIGIARLDGGIRVTMTRTILGAAK
jgi:hypothetical protein